MLTRRGLMSLAGGTLALSSCRRDREEPEKVAPAPNDSGTVRVASVRTAMEGGLLPHLLELFHASSPLRVSVTIGEMVYSRARALQSFLLAPATQAAIRTVRYPGAANVAWVPAGRHNRTAILPS